MLDGQVAKMTKNVSGKTLVVPPKKWRNSASLRGYAGQLRAAISEADHRLSFGLEIPYPVAIELKTAKALLEIVCQAIHTEQGHGS